MKVYLSRRYRFSASHRLHVESMSEEANQAVFGKCNNPHGHGHNYTVEVTFSGQVDAATGMVVNLADLDAFARERVVDRFDLQNLNAMKCFAEVVPSTENLSVLLHDIFAEFGLAKLERVHVEETGNNSFDYAGQE